MTFYILRRGRLAIQNVGDDSLDTEELEEDWEEVPDHPDHRLDPEKTTRKASKFPTEDTTSGPILSGAARDSHGGSVGGVEDLSEGTGDWHGVVDDEP